MTFLTNKNTDQKHSGFFDSLDPSEKEKFVLDLLTLINNLILACQKVSERIRIRYEFIGLKLMELFKSTRFYFPPFLLLDLYFKPMNLCSEMFPQNKAINEQINKFISLRNKDDYGFSANDVDLNSHFDVFHAIYTQVTLNLIYLKFILFLKIKFFLN